MKIARILGAALLAVCLSTFSEAWGGPSEGDAQAEVGTESIDSGADASGGHTQLEPPLSGACSRRFHDGTPFDLDMPFDGSPITEPRRNGTDPQFVFHCTGIPLDIGCDQVTIVNGTCIGTEVQGTDLVVMMTFDRNACVEVTAFGFPFRILTHEGNVNGDDNQNVLDLAAVKLRLFEAVDTSNFTFDLNGDNRINLLDMQIVKLNLFQPTPTCGTSAAPVN